MKRQVRSTTTWASLAVLINHTGALDAESETLVNQALGKLLQEKNTTISIAHRLSTIKRSDIIIVIGADGKVAEQGPYKQLAANPDGAFSKLMEWQLTGGDAEPRKDPRPTETEEIEMDLEKEDEDDESATRAGSGEPVTVPSKPTSRPK